MNTFRSLNTKARIYGQFMWQAPMDTFQIPPTTFTEFKTSKKACSSIALSCTRETDLKVNLHYYDSFKYVIDAIFNKGQPGPTIYTIVATDYTTVWPQEEWSSSRNWYVLREN